MFRIRHIFVFTFVLNFAFFGFLLLYHHREDTASHNSLKSKASVDTINLDSIGLPSKAEDLLKNYDKFNFTSKDNKDLPSSNVPPTDDSAPKKTQLKFNVRLYDDLKHLSVDNNSLMTIINSHRSEIAESNIFRLVNAYKAPESQHFNDYPGARPSYRTPYMGLFHDPHYCDVVDTYNLINPDNVLTKMNFIGDYIPQSLIRKTIFPELGQDLNKGLHIGITKGNFTINPRATTFFMKSVLMHNYYKIGTHFMCASQIYNHIPGNGVLTRKDLNVGLVNNYAKKYEHKPQCFNKHMYFPYAYRLNNKTECLQFFEEVNTTEYQILRETEPIPFLLKVGWGAHRGMGLYLFDEKKEQEIVKKYNAGGACGNVKDDLLVQKYISNPLLLDKKNKFDFRMYMLITSVDPLIVYYHDGFLRVSLSVYDKDSKETAVHFTNTHLSKKIFEDAANGKAFHGMNEQELRDYQMWTMEDLQDYLLEKGKIQNKQWLDEYLRPKFKEAFIHTVRMAKDSFMKLPGAFEMFGLDYLLDENLNLWFIECNASPQLVGTNEYKTEFLTKMLKDMFEIQYAYLRSRWTRIQQFVQKFHSSLKEKKKITDINAWREEYAEIVKNRLEPEFEISENNSWQLILNKNIPGKEAYLGLFNEECIDEDEF